jgi:hypothetical protein
VISSMSGGRLRVSRTVLSGVIALLGVTLLVAVPLAFAAESLGGKVGAS